MPRPPKPANCRCRCRPTSRACSTIPSLATLRKDYADPKGGTHFAKGALVAFSRKARRRNCSMRPVRAPSIESVAIGRDAIYAAITDNVIGSVHVFRHDAQGLVGQRD